MHGGRLRSFRIELSSDRRGGVVIFAAVVIMIIAVLGALVLDGGSMFVERLREQRVADLASLAAARTSDAIVNGSPSSLAVATAANVAAINGYDSTAVTTTAVASADADNGYAIQTAIARTMPMLFAPLFNRGDASIGADARAAPAGGSGPCFASLLGPTNVYGFASVDGPKCEAKAKTYLYVCGTAKFLMDAVTTGYSAALEKLFLCPGATYTPSLADFETGETVTDPIASTAIVIAAKAKLAAMASPGWTYGHGYPAALLSPSLPSGLGTDVTVNGGSRTLAEGTVWGTLTLTNATVTVRSSGVADTACTNPTTIKGNIVLNGTSTLTFESGCYRIQGYVKANAGANVTVTRAAGADVTFVFSQYITNDTGRMEWPDATYSIAGTVYNAVGGTLVFGSGKFVFGAGLANGAGTTSFGNGPFYFNGGSISNGTGTLSFGRGPFYLWGGSMSNASTGGLSIQEGPFFFYGGTVYNVSGTMTLGQGPFYFYGGSLTLSSGSVTSFGVGDMLFYGGSVIAGGQSVTFGAGGSAANGSGTIAMYGGTFSLTSRDLTAVGVTFLFQGGTLNLLGVGTINATAPTAASPSLGFRNLLFYVYGGAFSLYQSSHTSDTLSGMIYVPISNASLYGNRTIRHPEGGCFGVIAGVVDIYQNEDIAAAPCAGLTTTSTQTAKALP